jgi:hypothetical protein
MAFSKQSVQASGASKSRLSLAWQIALCIPATLFFAWLCRFWIPYYAVVCFIALFFCVPIAGFLRARGYYGLALSLGLAVLLGGVLAMSWDDLGFSRALGS